MTHNMIRYGSLLRIGFLSAVLFAGSSCSNPVQDKTKTGTVLASSKPVWPKCTIDLAGGTPPDCVLIKAKYEEIVWENNSLIGMYMCVLPTDDPFDAYAWYVPPGTLQGPKLVSEYRRTGIVKADTVPDTNHRYTFSSSTLPCTVPPTVTPVAGDQHTKNTPHVIIE